MVTNLAGVHEDVGLIRGPAQCVKGTGMAVSWGVGCRPGLDLVWLSVAAV